MTMPFPTKLSDLVLPDQTAAPNLYTTLKSLRKTTLSLHSRLRSILIDAKHVTDTVHPHFPTLPLVANERCGSWYVPPAHKSGSAYFKSTDGHYGFWDFSLRRLNLQLFELLGTCGGAVLIDSTRRGKRMPDALRRTVPVWVLVWNRVLFGTELAGRAEVDWALKLQHPGLEPGEVRLIEARVDGWVRGLEGLGLNLEELRKKVGRPIRLCWVVHGEELPELEDDETEDMRRCCCLLVLCSVSRPVLGAEMSENGYVQGAADDAEVWSGGLTSDTFWRHTDELMAASEQELPDLLARLVADGKAAQTEVEAVQITPARNIFIAASQSAHDQLETLDFDLIVNCNVERGTDSARTISMACKPGKVGSKDFREKLPSTIACVVAGLKKNPEAKVLCVCETGKDHSVGVAVTLLCMLYNDEGQPLAPATATVDKQLVKKRLAWITSVKADANPSRSTLQAVNSFLMHP